MFLQIKALLTRNSPPKEVAEVFIAGSPEELAAYKQKLWVAIMDGTATEAEHRQFETLKTYATHQ
jgi:hypothetical protein